MKQEKIDNDRKERLEKHLKVIQLQKDRAELIEQSAVKI
jgi:hypothetical protein